MQLFLAVAIVYFCSCFCSTFALTESEGVKDSRLVSEIKNANANEVARVFFKTDPADGSQSVIGSWFIFTNWTLTLGVFGTAFLLSCAATAVYYVLFVVTEPSQQGRKISGSDVSTTSSWRFSFPQILDMIHMTYDVFSTLDLDNIECQKKILCEFQEPELSNDTTGIADISRKLSNFFLSLDIFQNYPHIHQYQEAMRVGQSKVADRRTGLASGNSTVENVSCDDVYQDCPFSIQKFNLRFNRVFGHN